VYKLFNKKSSLSHSKHWWIKSDLKYQFNISQQQQMKSVLFLNIFDISILGLGIIIKFWNSYVNCKILLFYKKYDEIM